MSMDPAIMAEAHEQMLGVFADRTLKLALHLQEAAMDTVDLNEFLDDEAFEPGFRETPTEILVARIAETLELTPAEAPTPPDAAAPAGGGPPAERSEERAVEGASPAHKANGHAPPAADSS